MVASRLVSSSRPDPAVDGERHPSFIQCPRRLVSRYSREANVAQCHSDARDGTEPNGWAGFPVSQLGVVTDAHPTTGPLQRCCLSDRVTGPRRYCWHPKFTDEAWSTRPVINVTVVESGFGRGNHPSRPPRGSRCGGCEPRCGRAAYRGPGPLGLGVSVVRGPCEGRASALAGSGQGVGRDGTQWLKVRCK